MDKDRQDGYYLVKFKGEWITGQYITHQDIDSSWSCWRLPGQVAPPWGFSDTDLEEIDEFSITP